MSRRDVGARGPAHNLSFTPARGPALSPLSLARPRPLTLSQSRKRLSHSGSMNRSTTHRIYTIGKYIIIM